MKTTFLIFVILLTLNLSALSNIKSLNKLSKVNDIFSNKLSVIKRQRIYTNNITTNYSIKHGEALNVYNAHGSIRFEGWDKSYVKITATKKTFKNCNELNNIHIALSTFNGLIIETVNAPDSCAKIDYVINVPKDILIGEVYSTEKISFNNVSRDIRNNILKLSHR